MTVFHLFNDDVILIEKLGISRDMLIRKVKIKKDGTKYFKYNKRTYIINELGYGELKRHDFNYKK